MTDQMKNVLIGLFVTAAITIMIAMILFLEPTIGDGKKTLQVRFANISGLTLGTRVTFAGKPIGEVVEIKELKHAREEADESGKVYLYELTLKLDSSADVYKNDDIAIKTTGLMGEKSIAILPKAVAKGAPAQLVTNEVLYANSIDPLENTFSQVSRVASRLDVAVGRFDKWFDENNKQISRALASFSEAMTQVGVILNSVDEQGLVPNLRQSLNLLNDNMQLVYTGLNDDQLLHKVADATQKIGQVADSFNTEGGQILRNLNQISSDIASGSGTLGRLVVGDDFYLRLTSLLGKGETLMNDINHYGLLFQYSKQWQRGRTKKANELKALDTPQQFRDYFEGELASMNTSLGRLTELLQRADNKDKNKVFENNTFKRDFAALLRQVQGFSDSLKLYNQELITDIDK